MKAKSVFAIPAIFIISMLIFFSLSFTGCDNATGGGGPAEYAGGEINVLNSYWDGYASFGGASATVTVYIPNATQYRFYINGSLDDSGTYTRNNNTATLTSSYNHLIVGTAVLTDPNTMIVSLNTNSSYPGTYSATRR